jgi:hypothetical protein
MSAYISRAAFGSWPLALSLDFSAVGIFGFPENYLAT